MAESFIFSLVVVQNSTGKDLQPIHEIIYFYNFKYNKAKYDLWKFVSINADPLVQNVQGLIAIGKKPQELTLVGHGISRQHNSNILFHMSFYLFTFP